MDSTSIDLVNRTVNERQDLEEAHNRKEKDYKEVKEHFKEMENGKRAAKNTLISDIEELIKSSQEEQETIQELLEKVKTCIKEP